MALNDVIEVVARGRLFAQALYNVWHFRDMGGGGTTFADLVSQFEDEGYGNPSIANFVDDFTIPEWSVQRIKPTVGPLLIFAGSFAGSSNADCTPQLALVTTWTTALGGRSHRGRTFWGGLGEDNFTSGLCISGTMTQFGQRAQSILDGWGPGGSHVADYALTVFSRLLGSNELITGFRTRLEGRTQRRRAIGIGA